MPHTTLGGTCTCNSSSRTPFAPSVCGTVSAWRKARFLTRIKPPLPCWSPSPTRTPEPRRCKRVRLAAADTLVESIQLWSTWQYWDAAVLMMCAALAYVWVKVFDKLASSGVLEQKLSRKLVHTTTGPLFMLTWPFFSALPQARLFAVVVPCLNFLRLLSVGMGWVQDPGLVQSVSRQGDRRELLKGPLYYCVVLALAVLVFWRDAAAGVVAVCMMCGGDGLADIIGRRWGTRKLPYNSTKSWAGSAAMFTGGLLVSWGMLSVFQLLGLCRSAPEGTALLAPLAVACGAATVVESLPLNHILDDNLSVPLVAAVLSSLLLSASA